MRNEREVNNLQLSMYYKYERKTRQDSDRILIVSNCSAVSNQSILRSSMIPYIAERWVKMSKSSKGGFFPRMTIEKRITAYLMKVTANCCEVCSIVIQKQSSIHSLRNHV